jgi:aminoglycoside phosphotransferase (APT) family kinase protein
VLSWADRLDRARWLLVVQRLAALHRTAPGVPPEGLTVLEDQIGLFGPTRARRLAGDRDLMALVARGWEHFARLVPADLAARVLELADDPAPLATALRARPCTLVHGDLATVNLAIEGDTLVLLDWGLAAVAPGALDLARFIAGCASVVDASREQMIADYREAVGPAYDETATRFSLLAGLVWLGWNKALDAAEHPDPAMRDREAADLAWWVGHGRAALDAGLV